MNIKTYIKVFIASIVILLSVFEILDYNSNPMEYKRVYHFGVQGVDWKYQNGQNFIKWNIGIILITFFYIILNLTYFLKFRENKVYKYIVLFVDFVIILNVFWFLYGWFLIDFDH